MGLIDKVNEMKRALKQMNADLSEKPDDKLIDGYKKAMKDYKDTGNKQCLVASELIKKELDKRGIKVEDTY